MNRTVIGVIALSLTLTNCAGTPHRSPPPAPVAAGALDSLLLSADDVDAVMGATMTAHPPISEMNDHRDLLRNRNCLGIWQPDEAVIYDDTGWTGVRRQVLRAPDTDQWNDRVVQSVVSFPTAVAARAFLAESSERWSKCTNHRLNITINDQRQPVWLSGDLNKTDTELALAITRGIGDQFRSCQRTLAVRNNVAVDVEACSPKGGDQAEAIVEKISRRAG